MKKMIVGVAVILLALAQMACAANKADKSISGLIIYDCFEDALDKATDVVYGNYIGTEPFGDCTLYYFDVTDRIYGNAPDSITVIAKNAELAAISKQNDTVQQIVEYNDIGRTYEKGKKYLLVLYNNNIAEAYKKILTYQIIDGIFIDAEDFSGAYMYGEPVNRHTKELDFSENSKEIIIDYIRERTADNVQDGEIWYGCIYSDIPAEIIRESPEIIRVRVDSVEGITRGELHDVDNMNCTVVESFKGSLASGDMATVGFFPDTVKVGEVYTVAVKVVNPGAVKPSCIFTSPKSLLTGVSDREIREIIADSQNE